ncbi:ABC transporter ATP-binding protein [Polynucleobacter sp. MWH-HuK1]|uniref:ABC transporter ATP-binding protein n=1 Tax=Polynucleobacter sp. MWH-HuK1 TaxID=1743158 RepID=UPI001C0AFD0B|nr:ABC transporter ATP-binding protein [Polynucleobacter sp. MWH-HuK1]
MIALTLTTSVAEVVSLGAVVPFIGILTEPERVFNLPILSRYIQWMGITTPSDLVLPLAVAFSVAAIVAAVLRLLLLWVSIRLSNVTGADLSVEVYRKTLYQPYLVHVARSSSEIISGITQKVTAATSVLTSLITVATSSILFIAILLSLFLIDPYIATVAMVCFGTGYGLIAWKTRIRLKRNSQCIAQQQTQVVKTLQEGLGAIRDVLLDGTQSTYTNIFRNSIQQLQKSTGENQCITLGPRYVMEALGMIMVAIFAYSLSKHQGGIGAALPILGALALGAQRLMPLLQQLYGNWSVVAGSQATLKDVLALLDQSLPNHIHEPQPKPISFKKEARFESVCFRYSMEGPWILKDISLSIPKGARIGFVGKTGSGKSTILDLFMRLLEPTCGQIIVDGNPLTEENTRSWQLVIAHVPQQIYLSDATIAENIAFGVAPNEIDHELVRNAAEQAQLTDLIEGSLDGYNTVVGERGVRLSGGQRQRIGIARALYKKAQILIFDEATSALDTDTENSVMAAIENLNRNLTILMVAHRLSTLQNCDLIVQLESGQISAQGLSPAIGTAQGKWL